jgi:hypothetical protein
MALTLTPTPYQTVLDSNGDPVSGAKVTTYLAGTTTAASTYTTSTGDVANANPIVADSAGRFVAYLSAGLSYKFVITTSADVAVDEQDNVLAVPGSSVNLDVTGTAGEAVAAGQVVYISSVGDASGTAGLWYLADASNAYQSTTAVEIGLAVSAIAINTSGTIRLAGEATTATSTVVGTKYYVSETAGAITSTAPTLSRLVGIAQTTSSLILNANPLTLPIIVSQGGTGKTALTAYGVLLGGTTTTGVVQPLTPAAAGQLLKSGGTGAVAAWTDDPSVATLTLSTPLAVASGGTGIAAVTANTIMLGAGTSDVTLLAPGTSGNVVTSNGTIWASVAPAGATEVGWGIVASVGSNALTVSLTTKDGSTPSSGGPVSLDFRNVTVATGSLSVISVTGAETVVAPSGATLGAASGVPFRAWVVAFNDGGTVRLGLINCASSTLVYKLSGWGIASSTTIGTGSDAVQTFYSDAGVTAKAYIILGYVSYESGLSTAGTYDAVPTRAQAVTLDTPLPGDTVQQVFAIHAGQLASTSSTYADTGLTASITPTSASNKVVVRATTQGLYKDTGNNAINVQLLRATTQIGLQVTGSTGGTVINSPGAAHWERLDSPASASAVVYKTQFAASLNTGNVYVQQASSTSTITLTEVMV